MSQNDRRRPLLAAGLAMVWPGLGHVYLREWVRALLWLGLVLSASHMLIPESAVPSTASLGAFAEGWRSIPLRSYLAIVAVVMMNVADAYWVATAGNHRVAAEEGVRCPNCGREVDQELDFCHWCTADLVDLADERPAEV